MPPSHRGRVRRPDHSDPRGMTPPPTPHTAGGADTPRSAPEPLDPINAGLGYDLTGERVDEFSTDCPHSSVAECVLTALMLGPGDYLVRRPQRYSQLWHFRVTEENHREALRSLAELLARFYPEMPRHIPEPEVSPTRSR